MMRTIIFALVMLASPAAAQQSFLLLPHFEMPRTIPWTNPARDGDVGTATFSGNRVYFRDSKGEHVSTMVVGPGGTRTMYDPHGKVIAERALPQ
jgi:hypothetical protein